MQFSPSLQSGVLKQRYKRFLADIETADGKLITAHCPNTGSMQGCNIPGSPVWYADSGNPKRKLPCTWELVQTPASELVCINTARANGLVEEAIGNGVIKELQGYGRLRREVPYGEERSRIDLYLDEPLEANLRPCLVEVKNVTLALSDGLGCFPDAVSTRGQKHLRELMSEHRAGRRAVLLFCVAHTGIGRVRPADHIDPHYGVLLREAVQVGVEVLAYGASISPQEIALTRPLPVQLD